MPEFTKLMKLIVMILLGSLLFALLLRRLATLPIAPKLEEGQGAAYRVISPAHGSPIPAAMRA
ncbi:MAG: hypothetical protein D6812_04380 [Deltaproteobacteria bacterium]|nr:MAG: hypothetical protein D6812_04380 [Deltaproteobacteria bacterium]